MTFGRYKVERAEIIIGAVLIACCAILYGLFNEDTAKTFDKPKSAVICTTDTSGKDFCTGP